MSRNVTLLQLRTDIAAQCDFSTSTTGRYTPTLLNRLVNQSIQRFRERISNEGMTHFLVPATGTLAAGPTSSYAFQSLDLSSLNPSLVRTYGVDITVAGVVVSLAHRPFQERNDFTSSPTMTGQPRAWAHFQTRSIAIMPAPDTSYPYTVWYLPVLADLTSDSDTFDGVAGWEVWVMWDCVCQLIARDQYATAYTQAIAERDLAWTDIVRSATKVSSAGGAVVGRDTMGQAGLWGRQPLRNIGASAGAATVTASAILGSPSEAGEIETTLTDSTTPIGFSWQKRRFWIQPNIDLTGATDATSAIQAALNARQGGCVYLPDGIIRLNSGITVPRGCALAGRPNGMNFGHLQYAQIPNVGTRINVYGTGKLFTMEEQSTASDLQLYYPDQQTNAAPTVFDYAFYCANGHHGPTIERIVAINPYRLMFIGVNGATVDAIQGAPISRGIDLGRCAEVVRVSRVLFNAGGVFGASGAVMIAWIAANGVAFSVDGAEAFEFDNCFAGGYQIGLDFEDTDGDNQTSYGHWAGGGIEGCPRALRVAPDTGLAMLNISNSAFVGGAASGSVIDFLDIGATVDKPRIFATNLHSWGAKNAFVNMATGSNGNFVQQGGMVIGYTGFAYRAAPSGAVIRLSGVGTETTSRLSPSLPADVLDIGGWTL